MGDRAGFGRVQLTNRTDPERPALEQEKRARRRYDRIRGGVEDLELWLHDLVRGGLAEAASRPWTSFEQMAERLVDAQAPGLARLVRDLGGLPHRTSGAPRGAQRSVGWPERMLIELGRLALVLNAARQLDSLEPDLRAEVRTLIGIAEGRADVLATEPIRDAWDVLGSRRIVGDRLSVQRTWLWGQRTARWALLLDFSVAGQPFGQSPAPGARIEADLCFYSGTARLRALIKEPPVLLGDVSSLPSQPIDRVLRAFAEALGRNPWQERIPAAVRDVVPHRAGAESWCAIGADGTRLPLAGPTGWHLLALSGGHPLDVFGAWDGFSFWPLSAMVEGRLTSLRAPAAA